MIRIEGLYGQCTIFSNEIEPGALQQIKVILEQKIFANSHVCVMPDVHQGVGCVIGFTANLLDFVVPNIVGVDIGCGMEVYTLGHREIDFKKLDLFIRTKIPHGRYVHQRPLVNPAADNFRRIKEISVRTGSDPHRSLCALGSLGGGNHFIEINQGGDGNKYLVVHSGSRHFGLKIAQYYQKKAVEYCRQQVALMRKQLGESGASTKEVQEALEKYQVPSNLAFLEGKLMEAYLDDMQVAQSYAKLNRQLICQQILSFLGIVESELEHFTTIHNYIDLKHAIVRKGAISAQSGEKVIIPLNMRDGSILALGKGNAAWNYSAPHGAGRILSRSEAKKRLKMQDYAESMKDVWTTSVSRRTLDESPMAYKPIKGILANIRETVDIIDIIKPIYNFKS